MDSRSFANSLVALRSALRRSTSASQRSISGSTRLLGNAIVRKRGRAGTLRAGMGALGMWGVADRLAPARPSRRRLISSPVPVRRVRQILARFGRQAVLVDALLQQVALEQPDLAARLLVGEALADLRVEVARVGTRGLTDDREAVGHGQHADGQRRARGYVVILVDALAS